MTTIDGWHHVSDEPPVDDELESDYLLLLTEDCIAPIVGYRAGGRYFSGASNSALTVRWWKPLEPLPAFLFKPSTLKWAVANNLVKTDEGEAA